MMTKKDLIEALKDLPDSTLIVLSKDSEGNSFSPLAGISSVGKYVPDNTWSGEFYTDPEDMEVMDTGNSSSAICLEPIN